MKKVIAAIIVKDNKYLIAQRAKKDANYEKWEFPGGKVEAGETDQECLKRELFEEFGVASDIGDYLCSSFFKCNDQDYEMRAYFVTYFSDAFTLFEHKQIRWVSSDEFSHYDFPEPDLPIIQALISHASSY